MLPLVEPLESRRLCARPPRPVILPEPAGPMVREFVKPNAANTGYAGKLTAYQGSYTVKTANLTIANAAFVGQVTVPAPGVTFINCRFDADWDNYCVQVVGSGSVKLYSCELIHANGGGLFGNNWLAQACIFHEMGSDATDGGGNNQLLDCYITHIGMNAGAHADGFQANNGSGIVIRNTNFDTPWWDQVGKQVYRCNSCCFLNGYVFGAKYLTGAVLDHDYFSGGNFAVYSLQQTNTSITNCTFDLNETQYGAMDGTVSIFSGNFTATGELL